MTPSTTRFTIAPVLLLIGTLTASASADGARRHCEWCYNIGQQHGFTGVDCESTEIDPDSGCYDCHVFNACHENTQSGSCSQFHSGCTGGDLDLDALELAVATGQWRTLIADSEHSKIRWNAERGAIQVFDCLGRAVGHYPIVASAP